MKHGQNLNEDHIDKLREFYRGGTTAAHAGAQLGISRSTAQKYFRQFRQGDAIVRGPMNGPWADRVPPPITLPEVSFLKSKEIF